MEEGGNRRSWMKKKKGWEVVDEEKGMGEED